MNRGTVKVREEERYADLRNDEVDGHLLAGKKIENLGVVGGSFCWSSWSSRTVPPPGKQSWGCRMMRWRRSPREGSIYRTKWAWAILTYLLAVSVKSEDTQVGVVTVHTVIKGLRR